MRWHTKPITQLVVMFIVMSVVISAQSTASALLTGNAQNKTVSQTKDTELRKVAGGCSYRAGGAIQTGQTETNPQNANPRWPISDPHYRGEYNVLSSQYFIQQTNNDSRFRGYFDDGGHTDGNVTGMLGSMFGYRPNQFTASYDMKYVDALGQGIRGNDPNDIKGDYPILQIPVPANKEVLMARTGYDIGGGEAMVVYADANRVTLHIGRHEYFVGTGQCSNGPCSGGYWIYLSDICVNDNIVDSYNSVRAAQEAAGPNLNPIQLPIVPEGYPLGRALGTSVKLALRDNGPFILMNKPALWQGYSEQNFGTTGTPPAGSPTVPATPPAGTPTTAPTVPPAGPTPGVPGCFYMSADVQNWQEAGKAKFNVTVKFHSAGGDGDVQLEKNNALVGGPNSWHRDTHNPYVWGPQWSGGVVDVDPGQSVPVKFTGHVWGSAACPGVRADMQCTFDGDGACSCGGTNCQAFSPPTPTGEPTAEPTAEPTLPLTPPVGTATPTPVEATPTPSGLPMCTWSMANCNNECMSGFICSDQCTQTAGKVRYCKPPTPTPLPGIHLTVSTISFWFEQCNGNQLCTRLNEVRGASYNGQKGKIDYSTGTVSSLKLGNDIVRDEVSGITRFHMNISAGSAPIPAYAQWGRTLLFLPENDTTAYIIKP